MVFSGDERKVLLGVKGVGPKVVARLEELGIDSFEKLSHASVLDIVSGAAAATGSTCWKNSPQARKAIEAAVAAARGGKG